MHPAGPPPCCARSICMRQARTHPPSPPTCTADWRHTASPVDERLRIERHYKQRRTLEVCRRPLSMMLAAARIHRLVATPSRLVSHSPLPALRTPHRRDRWLLTDNPSRLCRLYRPYRLYSPHRSRMSGERVANYCLFPLSHRCRRSRHLLHYICRLDSSMLLRAIKMIRSYSHTRASI